MATPTTTRSGVASKSRFAHEVSTSAPIFSVRSATITTASAPSGAAIDSGIQLRLATAEVDHLLALVGELLSERESILGG